MSRTKTSTRMSQCTVTQDGTLVGVFDSQGHHVVEVRSDVIKNSPSPGLPPAWRKPLPYRISVVHQEGPYGLWDFEAYGRHMVYEGSLWNWSEHLTYNGPGYEPPGYPSWHENHALIKALGKLKEDAVSIPVMFAERQETVDLITDNIGRLYRGYKSAKRGRFREAFGHLRHTPRNAGWDKELSSRILEFNFGVKPIVEDIDGIINLLARKEQQFGAGQIFKAQGSIGVKDTGEMILATELLQGKELQGPRFNRLVSEGVSTTVRLYVRPDCELARASTLLGLPNPWAVGWELLPFSFVVDYVTPLGPYFESLDAMNGFLFVSGCCTQMSRSITKYMPHSSGDPSVGFTMNTHGVRKVMKMDRTVYERVPVPLPPVFPSKRLNLKKGLNLISLMSALR